MFLDRGRYWLCRKFKKFSTEETTWVDTQGMKAPTVLCMRYHCRYLTGHRIITHHLWWHSNDDFGFKGVFLPTADINEIYT